MSEVSSPDKAAADGPDQPDNPSAVELQRQRVTTENLRHLRVRWVVAIGAVILSCVLLLVGALNQFPYTITAANVTSGAEAVSTNQAGDSIHLTMKKSRRYRDDQVQISTDIAWLHLQQPSLKPYSNSYADVWAPFTVDCALVPPPAPERVAQANGRYWKDTGAAEQALQMNLGQNTLTISTPGLWGTHTRTYQFSDLTPYPDWTRTEGQLLLAAQHQSSAASGPSSAGTRRPWWCGPTSAADGIGGHLSTFASSASALRDRLQPLLPRQGRRQRRRPHLHPGPRRTRHLRPRVPRGRLDEDDLDQLPPRDRRRQGPVELPAPAPDARLLGVPHGVDGPRPDQLALPGPLQPLPAQPPARRHQRQSRVWCFLGDGECDEPETLGRHLAGRPREARQPDLGRQLQPAAPRRPGARQRQDHPGARGRVPRRRLERDQGVWGTPGTSCSPRHRRRAAQQDEHHRRRRVPALHVEDGAYIREHFFGPDPRLRQMVEHLSDDDLRWLPRGGHDYRKLYAAYRGRHREPRLGAPTVILAKTIKGWTLGPRSRAATPPTRSRR
jgi:hypothetical protein